MSQPHVVRAGLPARNARDGVRCPRPGVRLFKGTCRRGIYDLGRFGASLAAFQISLPSGVADPITKIYSLDGEQRNRGVELNTFGEVTPGLRVLGGMTYLDARLTETEGHLYDGNHAIGAPGRPTTFRPAITNMFDNRYWIGNPTGYVISGMSRTLWLSMSVDF